MTHTPKHESEEEQTPQRDGVSSGNPPGYPDNPILLQFRELKEKRNHHLIDEPDFDAAVMQLIKQRELKAREIFVPVRGYEGLYEVSTTGRVRSLKGGRRLGRELKPANRNQGYLSVSLCKEGKARGLFIHRLVADAFISNPENKPCVNHIDGNPSNNDVSNLEWCTYSENEEHSCRVLGKLNGQAKIRPSDVPEIRRRLAEGQSPTLIAKEYGVDYMAIYYLRTGKTWRNAELQQSLLTKQEGE